MNKIIAASIAVAIGAVLSPAKSQSLDTLPVTYSRALCYASANNKIYCTYRNQAILVVDCVTNLVIDTIDVVDNRNPISGRSYFCYNNRDNIVYTIYNWTSIAVIDCSADSILDTISVGDAPGALTYDSVSNKVYCSVYSTTSKIAIIDCETNHVIKEFLDISFDAAERNPVQSQTYTLSLNSGLIYVIREEVGIKEPTKIVPSLVAHNLPDGAMFDALGRRATVSSSGIYFRKGQKVVVGK
jgi:hypothetical protein